MATWRNTRFRQTSTGQKPNRKYRTYYGTPTRRRHYPKGGLQELKFKDTVLIDTIVPTGGAITASPCLIAQGTGEEQRIGRKIIIRSISARFQLQLPSASDQADVNGGDTIRIIIYIDHQANGAVAAVLDILESATYDSYRNLSQKGRFQILKDKWVTFNRLVAVADGTNTSTTPTIVKQIKFYRKVDIPIEYNNTTGSIDEITSNNIGFLYITSFGLAGVVNQCTRIRYDG